MGDRHSTGRRPLELKLLQIFPSFQPRVQDIDLHVQSSRDRICSPGSPTSSDSTQLSELISNAEQDLSGYEKDIHILENVLLDLKRKKGEIAYGNYGRHLSILSGPGLVFQGGWPVQGTSEWALVQKDGLGAQFGVQTMAYYHPCYSPTLVALLAGDKGKVQLSIPST
ncbi:hypothetical protein D9758_009507 [Tetrapyrgos nigripes]|uniref:Uncharacterized protein n=1 Tax=Tetrapyrgos nigripes TaxID=182062 RepID=A0A8H5G165_9AGAR|nr:hypothetical protein D9758_009507 [Tetrapyrgos nigripes]